MLTSKPFTDNYTSEKIHFMTKELIQAELAQVKKRLRTSLQTIVTEVLIRNTETRNGKKIVGQAKKEIK